MAPFAPHYGHPCVAVEVVFAVLAAVIHKKIFLFRHELEDILLAECKWWSGPIGLNVLDTLRARAVDVKVPDGQRRIHLALFSRSGFTPEVVAVAHKESLLLFDFQRFPWA